MTPEPELFWGVEAVPVRIKRLLTSETLISVGLIWKETFSALVLVEYQVVSSERGPPASIVYRLPDYQLTSRVDRPHKGYRETNPRLESRLPSYPQPVRRRYWLPGCPRRHLTRSKSSLESL